MLVNRIPLENRIINLSAPQVMGVINLTPDSFYDGGTIKSDRDLLQRVEQMIDEGVDILDIGAYSSRPGATEVSLAEEQQKIRSGIDAIIKIFPHAILSVDTFRSPVAKVALESGALLVNDISAGALDDAMFDFISKHNTPYIMMHMRGNPQTMMSKADYKDLIPEIKGYFSVKIKQLQAMGSTNLMIDPGFGFAKTKEQNFELLNKLYLLQQSNIPILVSVSRKSMIYNTLNNTPTDALNGTTALNMACLMKGASMLRVHDVKEAKETIKLYQAMTNK